MSGPSAKPHLTQGTRLASPSLPKAPNKTPTKQNKAVGRGPRGCGADSPWHTRTARAARELPRPSLRLVLRASEGPSASPSAFHQQGPCCLPPGPALWGEDEAARSRSLSLLPDHHLWGGREQRRDSSCRTSREGYADSSLLPTAQLRQRQNCLRSPLLMSREVRDRPSLPSPPPCPPTPEPAAQSTAPRPLYLLPTPRVSSRPQGKVRSTNLTVSSGHRFSLS